MTDYISREALGIGKCNPDIFDDKGYAKGWNAAVDIVMKAPAADVRPVVYCKDCVYSSSWYRDKRLCTLWNEDGIDVFEDGFCNYGTKSDDEKKQKSKADYLVEEDNEIV